ncbi:MAG: PAS domain-containing protein [Flavobacteriales bacterium]|nr:PAS domain-containing protein [Flavobacteriales bacterium]
MGKPIEYQRIEQIDSNFILSEDPVAQKLLQEIYANLKQKSAHELSIAEHCWLRSIEDLYTDKKKTISNKVDWYVKVGHELIKEEQELNHEEKALLDSFRRVLDVSAKNNVLSTFFSELENSVEALFRLDYSRKSEIPELLESEENDLLNYIVMTVDMIRERLGHSVVSGKVVRNVMGRISDVGVLVTDEKGEIRFANDKIAELLDRPYDELIGDSIKNYLTAENTLLGLHASDRVEGIEIQQIIVPSVEGEIDEWVYTFSEKSDCDLKVERMAEIREVIDELSVCDTSDRQRLAVLLDVLKTKFSKIEELTIPASALVKSGSNLRELIDECLTQFNQDDQEIDILLDAKDNIVYYGDDKQLKTIIVQMLDCARENLLASPRLSKMEIVVSSFQHYLLIACLDNGAIVSNDNLVQEMRSAVEAIQGTLELNSGRLGNNLSIILPV